MNAQIGNKQIALEMAPPSGEEENVRLRNAAPHTQNEINNQHRLSLTDRVLSKKVREAILMIVVVLICICTIYSTVISPPNSQNSTSDAKQAALLRALYKLANTMGGNIAPIHEDDGREPQNPQ